MGSKLLHCYRIALPMIEVGEQLDRTRRAA